MATPTIVKVGAPRPAGAVGENGGVKLGVAAIRGGIIAAIAVVVLGAASATPWIVTLTLPSFAEPERPPQTPQYTAAPQEPGQRDPSLVRMIGSVTSILLGALLVALIAFGVYWLVRRLRASWRPEESAVQPDVLDGDGETLTVDIASLATAVARANAHLSGSAEPGDAVIAAWVALEDEAALQGTRRDPAQTATEFTTALLQRTPAPADAVAVLRGLYHRARFTDRPVTPDDVLRARSSITRIARALDDASADRRTEDEP